MNSSVSPRCWTGALSGLIGKRRFPLSSASDNDQELLADAAARCFAIWNLNRTKGKRDA